MPSEAEIIARAAYRLRRGGLVAFPTETVYGLGAVATDADAVEQVYELKGRPRHNPLIVHVDGVAMARRVAAEWPVPAAALARAFWPGPLSIVLERDMLITHAVTSGGPTVCVRCPDHPTALALISAVGGPLVGPSANRSGQVSPTTAEHVRRAFPNLTVVDGGVCRIGIESTVVRFVRDEIEILRPGVIGPEQIEQVTGLPTRAATIEAGAPLASPGLLERHYAPNTPVRILASGESAGATGSVLLTQDPGVSGAIHMPAEAGAYAAALYDAVRQADASGKDEILIVMPAGPGPAAAWDAVADRLRRMAAPDRGPA